MKFRNDDSLLSMSVVEDGTDPDVFVVFESGLAKRSKASQWTVKGRAILGVAVAKQTEKGGDLVGALTVDEDDEVMVVFERGNIVRSRVDEVRLTGRNTAGVRFAKPGKNDAIVGVARNAEKVVEEEVAEADAEGVSPWTANRSARRRPRRFWLPPEADDGSPVTSLTTRQHPPLRRMTGR